MNEKYSHIFSQNVQKLWMRILAGLQTTMGKLWMTAALMVLLLGLIVSWGDTGNSVSDIRTVESFSLYLDDRIPQWMQRHGVPGVNIVLIRNGEVAWSNAYGLADRERNLPMTVNTICRAESISKSVTAWGVLRLVDQGLIDMDAPVQTYISDRDVLNSQLDDQLITVRMLLSNTAGLPLGTIGEDVEYNTQTDIPSLEEYLTTEMAVIQKPGDAFLYSNVGFNLLELIIEDVSGQDFADYMADEIIGPLGMLNGSYDWNDSLFSSLPPGYDLQGEPVLPYFYPVMASGGLLADVESIAQFVSAGMEETHQPGSNILSQESIRLLYTPQVEIPGLFGLVADSYGFGHFIERLSNGKQAVWHGGQGHGWMSHFHMIPETGDGIVILTNSQRSWPLIAQVLSAWTKWRGLGQVKFSRIIYGSYAMLTLIGIVALAAFREIYQLIHDVAKGIRKWSPMSRDSLKQRAVKMYVGIGGIIALSWSAAQPYLFINSIFPSTATIAGISLFGLCIIFIVVALFPRTSPSWSNDQ